MRKIKVFGCGVLVIALVIMFTGIASAYTPTQEDLEFIEWVNETEKQLWEDFEEIARKQLEICVPLGHLHVLSCLIEIDNFSISPELEPLREEYGLELQEVEKVYDCRESAKNALEIRYFSRYERYIEEAEEHMQKALSHRKKVRKYLERGREGKALPGFEAIFAIAGLLAVAYLVRRRK